jgi:hypothetical protein
MKIAISLYVFLIIGIVTVTTDAANAVVYCQYIDYPASCVVRPGVVLRPRVVAPVVVVRPVVVAPVRRGAVVVR